MMEHCKWWESDRNLDSVRMVCFDQWAKTVNNLSHRRRQRQCTQTQAVFIQETAVDKKSSKMASSYFNISPIISIFVFFLFFTSSLCPALSSTEYHQKNQTFRPGKQLRKLKAIRAHLVKINKPSLKTIQAFFSSPAPCFVLLLVFSVMGCFIWLLLL